jgi:hypothetical protein
MTTSGICDILCECIMIVLWMATLATTVSLFIVWITAISNGNTLYIEEDCPNNTLWYWLIVCGILISIDIVSVRLRLSYYCSYLMLFAGNVVVCWWGRREIDIDDHCVREFYADKLFYKTAIILWWSHLVIQCAVVALAIIVIMITLGYLIYNNCKKVFAKSVEEKQADLIVHMDRAFYLSESSDSDETSSVETYSV